MHACIVGDNFDIAGPEIPRIRRVNNLYWISRDNGKTWKPTSPDTGLYVLFVGPFSVLPSGWRVVSSERDHSSNGPVTRIRVEASGEPPEGAPQGANVADYWIGTMSSGERYVQRFKCVEILMGAYVWVDATFNKINAATKIEAPDD
jgi:hypothetical protein